MEGMSSTATNILDTTGVVTATWLGQLTIVCIVTGLAAGKRCRLVVEDSLIGDWTDKQQVCVFDVLAPVVFGAQWAQSRSSRELPGLRYGASGNKMRIVEEVDASPGLTYTIAVVHGT